MSGEDVLLALVVVAVSTSGGGVVAVLLTLEVAVSTSGAGAMALLLALGVVFVTMLPRHATFEFLCNARSFSLQPCAEFLSATAPPGHTHTRVARFLLYTRTHTRRCKTRKTAQQQPSLLSHRGVERRRHLVCEELRDGVDVPALEQATSTENLHVATGFLERVICERARQAM